MKKKYRVTMLGYFVFSGIALLIVLAALKIPSLMTPQVIDENKESASSLNSTDSTTVNSVGSEPAGADPNAAGTASAVADAEKKASEEADLKAIREKELRDMQLSIFFEPNKYDVSNAYYSGLDKFVLMAAKYPDAVIVIEGNYNGYPGNKVSAFWTSLASNRAEVVSAYLVAKGISQDRMKLVNNGCSKMIHKDDSLEELGKNRRVDLTFAKE